MRLSGLLWPEARERLADSAYLTVERLGNGQVILFASSPASAATTKGPEDSSRTRSCTDRAPERIRSRTALKSVLAPTRVC
jgi:hypothetical protein